MKPEPNAFCLYFVFYFNTGPFYSVLIQDLFVRSCSWRWINRYKLQFNVGQGKCPKVGLNLHFCDWGSAKEEEPSFGRGNQERLPSRAVGMLEVQQVSGIPRFSKVCVAPPSLLRKTCIRTCFANRKKSEQDFHLRKKVKSENSVLHVLCSKLPQGQHAARVAPPRFFPGNCILSIRPP